MENEHSAGEQFHFKILLNCIYSLVKLHYLFDRLMFMKQIKMKINVQVIFLDGKK